ncbi:hypothetical protein QUA79_16525 [Microcoleus sp. F8-D1]
MKAAQLEIGFLRLSCCDDLLLRCRRKESEGRSQKKCFYKYETIPTNLSPLAGKNAILQATSAVLNQKNHSPNSDLN